MILLFALLAGLEEQTILRILDAHFSGDYLLYDMVQNRLAGGNGLDAEAALPIGSLIKPFTTIAYGEAHQFRYPEFTCGGKDCWLPQGHGKLRIAAAIGHSCNAYFQALSSGIEASAMAGTLTALHISRPPAEVPQQTLFGLGPAWKFAPREIARAYGEMARRSAQPGVREALEGMRIAAKAGTAKALGSFTLAKTGTAPCAHDAGDGFTIAMFPADSPRYVLMARRHNSTGAQTAAALAPAMRLIRDGR